MIVFNQFKKFLAHDMAAGIVLAFAAVLAMVVANSPMSDIYEHFLHLTISIKIGSFSIDHHLLHWINDGLMVVFFFLVGLELKREMLVGVLCEVKTVVLPDERLGDSGGDRYRVCLRCADVTGQSRARRAQSILGIDCYF